MKYHNERVTAWSRMESDAAGFWAFPTLIYLCWLTLREREREKERERERERCH